MKKILFTVLLCLVLCVLSAQSRKQVQEYYYWINQAELAICDSNLLMADSLYTRAFSIKKPLAREMRTAFWVAIQTGNDERILQIAKQRIELGGEGLANSYQYLARKFDSATYKQLLFIEENTPQTYHTEFDTILGNLIERDQRYRIQGMGRSPEQFALDDENRKLIKQFYREYPDFNEYVAGFYYMGMLGVVLLHAVQTDHYDLQPLLRKKVMAGIFPAENYMEFESCWGDMHSSKGHQYGSGLNNIYYIGNTLFVEQPDNLKQIDKNREKLGLAETWQDAVKKRVWECEHNTYYITGSRQSRIYGDEEDDAAEVARLKQEIDAEHAAGDFHRMYYEKGSKVSE
ncbi:MAG: hypothetical protein IJP65_04005 [Bacteroidales bacterium]|nr:hypothetical protein [Bacteroidales bacterium]